MNDVRERLRPLPVRALDEGARRFVRPGDNLDDSTMRLHEAPTQPERSFEGGANIFELRSRGPERLMIPRALVDDVLRDVPDGAKQVPAPVDVRGQEPPTMPDDRSGRSSSDVFQSLVPEPPTPRDRPLRFDERPTDLDIRQVAPTATYHAARDIPVQDDQREESPRDRVALATAHERALVASMYDSQRKFLTIESDDPRRAEHITSVAEALKTSDVFSNRERVLAIHARQRVALEEAPPQRLKEHEDQVIAIALVARDLDDRYRDTMRALRDQLVNELPLLPTDKRQAVYADFESFVDKGGANDSHSCRRELDAALNNEVVLHRAYVYALALAQPSRPTPEHDASTLIIDEERKQPNE